MGSGCSNAYSVAPDKKQQTENTILPVEPYDDEELDNKLLFQALFKLSFTMEINEYFEYELMDEVHKYTTGYAIEYQTKKIQKWIKSSIDINIPQNEVAQLIRYIHLYEHPGFSINRSSIRSNCSESSRRSVCESSRRSNSDSDCSLQCPFVSDQPVWNAKIRHQELFFEEPSFRLNRMSSELE
jgi:hypothetical protein